MAYSGYYKPENREKYVGVGDNLHFRSMWEWKYMMYCDKSPSVLKWAYEELVVPYISPLDGRIHKYIVDFVVEFKTKSGPKTFLLEIKPAKEVNPPVPPKKRMSQKYLAEQATWSVNQAKWAAATAYAENLGWKFRVLTEKELAIAP